MVFRLNEALRYSCRILIELSSLPTVSGIYSESDNADSVSVEQLENVENMISSTKNYSIYKQHSASIPEWLQYLLVSSCLLSPEYADLQLESINTLLEMVDLLNSGIEQRKQHSNRIVNGENTAKKIMNENMHQHNHFVIVMRPMMKEGAHEFIFRQTVAPQVIAAKLWDGLGAMRPVHHLACVKQLHRLHNIVPDPTSIERIVARTLGYEPNPSSYVKTCKAHGSFKNVSRKKSSTGASTVDAFQRFTLFWHLSRDQIGKKSKPGEAARTFDVCLLKMLDNLNLSSGPLKTLSQSWLIHAMVRGDIARIMEPLFLTLLDPTTARVSVLHCRIDHSNMVKTSKSTGKSTSENDLCSLEDTTHKIYTIATSHGVFYHVSEKPVSDSFPGDIEIQQDLYNGTDKSKPIFSRNGSDRAMHLFALNSINNDRTCFDHRNWGYSCAQLNSDKKSADENEARGDTISSLSINSDLFSEEFPRIPLLVNPFALVPPNVDDFESYTKGYYTETQDKVSIPENTESHVSKSLSTNELRMPLNSKRRRNSYCGSTDSSTNNTSTIASSTTTINHAASQSSLFDSDIAIKSNVQSLGQEMDELEGFPCEMSSMIPEAFVKSEPIYALHHKKSASETIVSNIVEAVINEVVLSASTPCMRTPSNIGEGCATGPSSFDSTSLNRSSDTSVMNNALNKGTSLGNATMPVHPLHSHILLYTQVSDSRQVLYSMQCVKNMLQTNPRLAICTLSTTSLNSSLNSARSYQIQTLLARHRKSVFGRNFAGDLASENMATYRNSTLVEVLISTALYYLRSYYPNMGRVHLRDEDIQGNREVQLMSIDIMVVLVSELILVVRDNSQGYATYISDLFARCKVQKVVLHCLLAGVNDIQRGKNLAKTNINPNDGKEQLSNVGFTEDILRFNEISSLPESESYTGTCEKISNYSEAFQVQILRLLLSLVMLEQIIAQQKGASPGVSTTTQASSGGNASKSTASYGSRNTQQLVLRYMHDQAIPDQPMFLAAIISALRHDKMRHLHPHWTSLVNSCLPFLGKSLSVTVVEVTSQLCRNLEKLAPFYSGDTTMRDRKSDCKRRHNYDEGMTEEEQLEREEAQRDSNLGHIPADYIVTQLEALTVITHYCLLESNAQVNVSFPQPGSISNNGTQSGLSSGNSNFASGDILNNLLHVFISHNDAKNLVATSLKEASSVDSLQFARKNLLSTLPRLVASCATLWASLDPYLNGSSLESRMTSNSSSSAFLAGDPKIVRSKLLDLLSPVAHHHSVPFLSAISVAWQERKTPNTLGMVRRPLPTCNDKQSVLVDLVASIRTMPVATVIQTVRQVLKTPPSITGHSGGSSGTGGKINVEISVLQFFHFYLARCSPSKIVDLWPGLATLLKDCLALAPSAIFLAMAILDRYVHISSHQRDSQKTTGGDGHSKIEISRKESKELQELAGKLVDECSRIGGSCLEQTTWLRRNMAVRHDLQTIGDNQEDMDLSETSTKLSGIITYTVSV